MRQIATVIEVVLAELDGEPEILVPGEICSRLLRASEQRASWPTDGTGSDTSTPAVLTMRSFNGRFRDEFLTTEQFDTLLETQVLAEDWRTEYNTIRPHGSLDGLTPTQFRAQWINQPALS